MFGTVLLVGAFGYVALCAKPVKAEEEEEEEFYGDEDDDFLGNSLAEYEAKNERRELEARIVELELDNVLAECGRREQDGRLMELEVENLRLRKENRKLRKQKQKLWRWIRAAGLVR